MSQNISDVLDTIEEALKDLKAGKSIIVVDDEDRENEGDLIALAEHITAETINFMITEARGLVCVPISAERAEELDLPPMVSYNTDYHGTNFTVSVDHITTKTGISAHERAATVRALVDGSVKAADFRRPGHIFPLISKKGGVLQRAGHTEAATDLAGLCGSKLGGAICEIIKEDGTMARLPDLIEFKNKHNLKLITIRDLILYRSNKERLVERAVEVDMPTTFGDFRAVAYTNHIDGLEHVALVKGDVAGEEPVLVRVHAEDVCGDVFHVSYGSSTLAQALRQIEEEGKGVLLYMRQEETGLVHKLKAYKEQQQGNNQGTDSHTEPSDLKEYGIGAQILKDLGINRMRLMTNNPRKITGLEGYGLEVTELVALHNEQ